MKVLELFSGTGNFSRIARERGHETLTVDLFEPSDLNADIRDLNMDVIYDAVGWEYVDLLWASPPCDGFSVASIGRMWHRAEDGTLTPKHETSRLGLEILQATIRLIEDVNPLVWFIENPRGMMRKMPEMDGLRRETVTYCQYGEERQKPTDVWHSRNSLWVPRAACKRGAPCHVAAPRGSLTGTQGIKGKQARSRLPDELCEEVIEASEEATFRVGQWVTWAGY